MKGAALAAIRFYKRNISPSLPAGCRYQPTCSEYAAEAIEVHGLVKGIGMGIGRLARCHPWSRGGLDPVPEKATNRQTGKPANRQTDESNGGRAWD